MRSAFLFKWNIGFIEGHRSLYFQSNFKEIKNNSKN
jgi:hypothetical protein